MASRVSFAIVAAALVASACSSGAPTAATPSTSPSTAVTPGGFPSPSVSPAPIPGLSCKKPKPAPFPDWVPTDLPLPKGTYAYQRLEPLAGYKRALFVVSKGSTPLARFVLKEWPKAGFVLGRGDAEPGEVEDQFVRSPGRGAFKANDLACKNPYTVMYLIWAPKGPVFPSPSPTPSS
jgi:hypothetical protein